MRAPRQGQVDVELVETVGDDVAPEAEPGADWRELVRRVPGRAWAVTATVVALGVGVVGAVEWRADRAQAARLAGTDGLTVSLAEPLAEVWRAPRQGVVGVVGDVAVLHGGTNQGVLGVGVRDGETRWEQPVGGAGWCWLERLGPDDRRFGPWSAPPARLEAGEAVLGCADSRSGGIDEQGTEVTVLDPAEGGVLRRFEVSGPGTGSTSDVDDGVASLGLDDEGRVVAGRWDLLTGERTWAYVGPRVDLDSQGVGSSISGDTMTVASGAVSVTLDAWTGEVVGTEGSTRPVVQELDRLPLADGGVAVSTAIGEERFEIVVQDEDGEQRFLTGGYALRPVADDGSAPQTLLLSSPKRPGIMAVDARTGDELWRSRVSSWQVAVLAGLVILRDEQRLTALDARTGATVWTREDPAPETGVRFVTDGRVLLMPVRGDGGTDLLARVAETGRELWRAPAPVAEGYLEALPDGRVLVIGSGETVVLAP
ncbi:PQQ-binding-like beta-propeller repeat protein [Cellulomonas sp. NS3]|uniref:outer membrane protein assembly factor BamB family protein n=1 Tax=Cellulomonas sp. NS3 TaxID=2973977 RepID=UPI002161EF9E|nr:PQQ-binding-like beta-propeller repeat protein [Cellulomonas sp. NS3]